MRFSHRPFSPHLQHISFAINPTIMSCNYMSNVPVIEDENDLLSCGICRVKIEATLDTTKWAAQLSQVTPLIAAQEDGEYAFYRNIMEEPDFPFDAILNSEIGVAIRRYFGVSSPQKELRLDDAFCVSYNMDQYDTTGAKHTDPSDITVNMCLEKTRDTKGSQVLFHGQMPLIQRNNNDNALPHMFLVNQEPGFATIHWGVHAHETTRLKSGKRTNVILTYCFRDEAKSQAHKRTCYFPR